MRKHSKPQDILQYFEDRNVHAELSVCRYHRRSGKFDSKESLLQEHLITFVEQGELEACIDDKELKFYGGEALWLCPGVSRRYYSNTDGQRSRLYNFRFVLQRETQELSLRPKRWRISNAWDLQPTLQQLYDLDIHGHPFAASRLRGLLTTLATTFLALAQQAPGAQRQLTSAQRLHINQYIVDHIASGLTPGDLAEEMSLSLDYFTRLFRASYGMAPRMYLKQERMRMAAIRLQETTLTVSQISNEFGMDNASLFCRQFRSVFGCTPAEYRKRSGSSLF